MMIYESKKQITYNDIDANWEISLTAVLKYMNEATWANGEELGIGVSQIPDTGLAFVTQRIAIKVFHPPVLGEEFILKSWPAEIKRTTFTRKGEFLDSKGQKMIEWESLWVLFDINERKIKRPSELKVEVPCYGDRGVTIATEKIHLPVEENPILHGSSTYQVQFSDLDSYQHMTNTHYGNLLINAYRERDENITTFMKSGAEIHFNYHNEGQLDDQITVTVNQLGNAFYFTGETDEHKVFTGLIK
jgi:acyl-ACP thioesterase